MELNQNLTDCIRSVGHIGSTTYVNICNNVERVVPWGSLDWLLFVVLVSVAAAFVTLVTAMTISVIND